MVENAASSDKQQTAFGEIEVAPEVLEVIAGIAANQVDSVYAMQGKLSSGVSELFGKVNHKKGVHLTSDEDGLKVDVYCFLKYGARVPEVAGEIQRNIKEQVLQMTDITLAQVNIHIAGIVAENSELPELLDLDIEEDEIF